MYPCKYFKISLNDQEIWWIQTDLPTPTPGIRTEINRSPLPLVGGGEHKKLAQKFNFPYNYIDDVLRLNNSRISEFIDHIHLCELEIKYTTESNPFCLIPSLLSLY